MIVCNNSSVFPQDPIHHLGFDAFNGDKATADICLNLDSPGPFLFHPEKRNILLDLELPNRFFETQQALDFIKNEFRYHKILTICPEVVEARNKFLGRELYKFIPFPTSEIYSLELDKDINVIYTGNDIHWLDWVDFPITVVGQMNKRASIRGVSYYDKIRLISRSKISLVHNEIFVTDRHRSNMNLLGNKEHFVGSGETTLSQFKSRVTEAALNKSLLLCKYDDYNIIEKVFPKNCFVYFRDEKSLNSTVKDILSHYDSYIEMIEAAYLVAKSSCTTESIYKNVICGI